MDPRALSLKMRRLQSWLQTHECHPTPCGYAEVTVDATSTAPAASFNRNQICLCGAEGGLSRDGLNEMIGLFAAQGVTRFFVWLSPGSGIELVREWLSEARFVKVSWTRYPTLAYCGNLPIPNTSNLEIRRVGGDEIAAARLRLGEAMMAGYVCTHIVSQTLTMLKESLANLQRAGFREIYEQEVYESPH